MSGAAFYNEIDPYAAAWLRNLIDDGHIAPGVVDERSIVDLDHAELRRYQQCHFFAGIGVWSYALRLAGWPDDRPVWTGSCPCQPFSAAGRREGDQDERHLWPAWHRLIRECRPAVVYGEQVAGGDGLAWLDLVLPDLEDDHYAVAAADLPAAGVGAPHIRQRLFFVGHAHDRGGRRDAGAVSRAQGEAGRSVRRLADGAEPAGAARVMADTDARGQRARAGKRGQARRNDGPAADAGSPSGAVRGWWADAEWIACRDGKRRPIEPGTFPLVAGFAGRVGMVRAYGNAINAEAAKAFIRATM